jgi:hypothetical protein
VLEAVPSAVHRDDATLPFVTVDQGVEPKVLQTIDAGLVLQVCLTACEAACPPRRTVIVD